MIFYNFFNFINFFVMNPEAKFEINGVEFCFQIVREGKMTMGATPETEEDVKCYPIKEVEIEKPFLLGTTVVTQLQWEAIMGTYAHKYASLKRYISGEDKDREIQYPVGDNYPAMICSRFLIPDFLSKFNSMCKINIENIGPAKFALPTEIEWQYAARGGSQSKHYRWSGGNMLNKVAWNEYNSGDVLHQVGQLLPNELGLYDMSGNVQEACTAQIKGKTCIRLLGGSYLDVPNSVLYCNTWFDSDDYDYDYDPLRRTPVGFRLAIKA